MKPLAAHNEDKLLDYAYGELSGPEAKSLEAHLQSCPECTQALGSIQKVRRTMSRLPPAPVPSAGLDSLIAYARQSARRAQSKAPTRWSRLWLPGAAASVAALGLVVVISSRVYKAADLSRSALTKTAEQEPLPQTRFLRAAPPAPSTAYSPTSDELRGNDDGMGLADVAKKRAGGPTPHLRVRSKETDQRESKDEAESKGVIAETLREVPSAPPEPAARHSKSEPKSASRLAYQGAKTDELAGDLGKLDEKQRSEDRRDTAAAPAEKPKVGAGELSGRAREESTPAGAPSAAQGLARSPLTNAFVPDHRHEIDGIRRSLSNPDLSGSQRAALLGRLCALLYEAGQRSEADSTCDAVIRDFPKTDAAASARRLKAQYAPARPSPEK